MRAEKLSRESEARALAAASRSGKDDPLTSVRLSVDAINETEEDNIVVKEAIDSLRAVLPGALLEMRPLTDKNKVASEGFSGNGSGLITVNFDGDLTKWDLPSGKRQEISLPFDRQPGEKIGSPTLSPNGKMLAFSTSEHAGSMPAGSAQQKNNDAILKNIKLVNLEIGNASVSRGYRRGVLKLTFDNDGEYLATSNILGDYKVVKVNTSGESKRMWDKPGLIEKVRVRIFRGRFRSPNTFAFSSHEAGEKDDQFLLATGFQNGEVVIRHARSGREYASLPKPDDGGHSDAILAMAFDPSKKYLITSSRDNTVKVWNLSSVSLQTGKKTLMLVKDLSAQPMTDSSDYGVKYHDNPVTSIAFNRKGELMATGSEDRTAIIWRIDPVSDSFYPLVKLPDHMAQIISVTFSADGKRLATLDAKNMTRIWDLSSLDEFLKLKGQVMHLYEESKYGSRDITDAKQLGIEQLTKKIEDFLKPHEQKGSQ